MLNYRQENRRIDSIAKKLALEVQNFGCFKGWKVDRSSECQVAYRKNH